MRNAQGRAFALLACACLLAAVSLQAAEVGTAFTYQGSLEKPAGTPVTGTCDFRFGLWDAANGGAQMGSSPRTLLGVSVSAGTFTVELDFGAAALDGNARFLEIEVRCTGDVGLTKLAPRVALTPAPYALALSGLRTQQSQAGPNVLGGHPQNAVSPGKVGATIAGGGSTDFGEFNQVTDHFGTVGGGLGNSAGFAATAIGGQLNAASGNYSAVLGGATNLASADYAVAAGVGAKAVNPGTFVWADGTGPDFQSTAANQFLIRASGGVGIGKTNPNQQLDVAGTIASTGLSVSSGTVALPSNQIDSSEVSFNYATSLSKGGPASNVDCSACITLGSETSGTYDATNDTIADDGTIQDSEASDVLTINNGLLFAPVVGNVGIGTTTPSQKLEVAGTIASTGLSVTSGTVALPSNQIDSGEVSFNFANSSSKGGPAIDLVCTDCVSSTDLATNAASLNKVSGGALASVGGNVGIGTASPSTKLEVSGAIRIPTQDPMQFLGPAETIRYDNASMSGHHGLVFTAHGTREFTFGTHNGTNYESTRMVIDQDGDVFAKSFQSPSDARYKKNVHPIDDPIKRIENLNGVYFEWRREDYPSHGFSDSRQVGLVAQEVKEVLPEAVHADGDGLLSVDYGRVVALLVEGMKQQQAQTEERARELTEERVKVAALSVRLEQLESEVRALPSRRDGGGR